MDFKTGNLASMHDSIEIYGDKTASLLCLGDHPGTAHGGWIEKKLLAARGELFLSDRYIKFKCNGGFSRLKEQTVLPYKEITGFEANSCSTFLNWKFTGGEASFRLGLEYYGSVKGVSPRDVFWYDAQGFPERSGAFFSLIKAVLPETGLEWKLKPRAVRETLTASDEFFRGGNPPENSGMDELLNNNPLPGYSAVVESFSRFLAGTAAASPDDCEEFADIFVSLNPVFAGMLRVVMEEVSVFSPGLLTGDSRIYDMGEKFEKLSSIWYLRQTAALHFAPLHLPRELCTPWPMKVLMPRARETSQNGRRAVSIRIPEPDVFNEAMERLEE